MSPEKKSNERSSKFPPTVFNVPSRTPASIQELNLLFCGLPEFRRMPLNPASFAAIQSRVTR